MGVKGRYPDNYRKYHITSSAAATHPGGPTRFGPGRSIIPGDCNSYYSHNLTCDGELTNNDDRGAREMHERQVWAATDGFAYDGERLYEHSRRGAHEL
jgi:hypothetical protein